jgi:broad specificity phosphatase PhoE
VKYQLVGPPDPEEIAQLQARADAGDRNAAGRLGELLARQGDREGALRVWVAAYGASSATTRRIGELLAGRGDVDGAVQEWETSDAVYQNPAGLHQQFMSSLSPEEYLEWDDDPEDWAFTETEHLAVLLAERGDWASIGELRARARPSDPFAKQLAKLLAERGDEASIAELRARAGAGDEAAAKRLAELPPAQDGDEDAA